MNKFPANVVTPEPLAKSGTFNTDASAAAYQGAFMNGVQDVKQNMARLNVVGHATRAGAAQQLLVERADSTAPALVNELIALKAGAYTRPLFS